MIRIKSKRDNFRRCGMAHPKGPVKYPDGKFSQKELAVLKAEPMLTVEMISSQGTGVSGNTGNQKAIEKKKAQRSSVNSK